MFSNVDNLEFNLMPNQEKLDKSPLVRIRYLYWESIEKNYILNK